jgi:hypothetical protein
VLLLNECLLLLLLLLFISLPAQSGNLWIHPRKWDRTVRYLKQAKVNKKEIVMNSFGSKAEQLFVVGKN